MFSMWGCRLWLPGLPQAFGANRRGGIRALPRRIPPPLCAHADTGVGVVFRCLDRTDNRISAMLAAVLVKEVDLISPLRAVHATRTGQSKRTTRLVDGPPEARTVTSEGGDMTAHFDECSARPIDRRNAAAKVLAAIFLIALLTTAVGFGVGWRSSERPLSSLPRWPAGRR